MPGICSLGWGRSSHWVLIFGTKRAMLHASSLGADHYVLRTLLPTQPAELPAGAALRTHSRCVLRTARGSMRNQIELQRTERQASSRLKRMPMEVGRPRLQDAARLHPGRCPVTCAILAPATCHYPQENLGHTQIGRVRQPLWSGGVELRGAPGCTTCMTRHRAHNQSASFQHPAADHNRRCLQSQVADSRSAACPCPQLPRYSRRMFVRLQGT